MNTMRMVAAATVAVIAAVPAGVASTRPDHDPHPQPRWKLVHSENFSDAFSTADAEWIRDPQTADSPWAIDDLDDNGAAWHAISDPSFTAAMETFDVYRQSVPFGDDGWLTAELAAVDADKDGAPDAPPTIATERVAGRGGDAAVIDEPQWNAGAIIRPTDALPAEYRIEVRLRTLDFGGKRDGSFAYDGKINGYDADTPCMTGYPWTFRGSPVGAGRCDYADVTPENGFYYLGIVDHDNPAPHGNPGLHARRKVVMDGYFADVVGRYGDYATCNPATGEMFSSAESNYVGVNAIFLRGDEFMSGQNNVGNQYQMKTACGEVDSIERFGENDEYSRILTSAELQPELMPRSSYTFAIERRDGAYTMEYSGNFRHIGPATLRFSRDFVEDGIPIWHYNQTPDEYDGAFNQDLTLTGPTGTHVREDVWPAGSAYPDSFIIGDPHLNYYAGSASIDDIRLYEPRR